MTKIKVGLNVENQFFLMALRISSIRSIIFFTASQLSGDLDQHLSKVGVDAPISFFVGIGQCASRNSAPDSCVIKLGLYGP